MDGAGQAKLILTGEHAVVYGHPAIALAVRQGVRVRLQAYDGPTHVVAPITTDERLHQAIDTVLPSTGIQVHIESTVPTGRGMGSSAALSVALVRAWANWQGQALTPETTYAAAMKVERIFHGNPSGIDNTVSAQGGVLWYRKGPPIHFEPLPTPDWELVVLDTKQAGDTKKMVQLVADRFKENRSVLEDIGQLVLEVREVLHDAKELGRCLSLNHTLLCQLGVSNNDLNALVDWSITQGAYGAKLAGAGGGGVVIALTPTPDTLIHQAKQAGISAFKTRVTETSWQ